MSEKNYRSRKNGRVACIDKTELDPKHKTNDEYERHTMPPSCAHQSTQQATESHSESTAAPLVASVPVTQTTPPTAPVYNVDTDTDTAPSRAPAAPRSNGTRTLNPAPVTNSQSKSAEPSFTQQQIQDFAAAVAAAAEDLEHQFTDSVNQTVNKISQAYFPAEDDVLETDKENAVPERINVAEGDSAKDAQLGSSARSGPLESQFEPT
ncbi:hypothetical protein BJ741DRAFT_655512 [Chytriomyces cf. hyalinus JEL632]|nr:hypothetical protein BJ741DRAFT_655512 [Chytriomyces cf. hyalinus JEL632]